VPSPIAEAYLYARQLSQRPTAQALDKTTYILHEALDKCPDFALARVALAGWIGGGLASHGADTMTPAVKTGITATIINR
jgi:hypothetical protein